MKIKKGDKVQIISGKDKGKTGKVLQVSLENGLVSVEGLNLRYKNVKGRKQGEKGQRIQYPSGLHVAKVALLDPKTNKPTRIGYRIDGTTKVRIARKSGEVI